MLSKYVIKKVFYSEMFFLLLDDFYGWFVVIKGCLFLYIWNIGI